MAEAKNRPLKEQLLKDIEAWDQSQRGFQDIIRNALDIDKAIARDLMKTFGLDFKEMRGWGAGADLPPDFQRYAIVERIREFLAGNLAP